MNLIKYAQMKNRLYLYVKWHLFKIRFLYLWFIVLIQILCTPFKLHSNC